MAATVASPTPFPTTHAGRVGTVSILEASKHLRSIGNDELPKDIVRPTADSTKRLDEPRDFGATEVIDLSLLQTDRAAVVKQVYKGVTDWGIFQIVNHGLPLEVLQDAMNEGLNFFELPLEVKEKAGISRKKKELRADGGALGTYVGDNTKQNMSSLYWAETLSISSDFLDDRWPEETEKFTDAVSKFSSGLDIVALDLLQLIAESLGLTTDFFAKHIRIDGKMLRYNLYPACPRPTEILGAAAHTDPFILTVLLQDKVGGLEVEKDGEWVAIRPIEGALVVNVGDLLHAWSNGIIKSVLHRVLVNKEVHRLSIAAFWNIDEQFPISPPEEIFDESHPRQYKDFIPAEYIAYTKGIRVNNKSSVRNGVANLQEAFKFEN